MRVICTRAQIEDLPRPLVLVPTMGALHEGHVSLVRQGVSLACSSSFPGGCAVTVFVNPTQFNDPADLARYPRTLDADAALCASAGAACVVTPEPHTVYPPGEPVPVPDLPAVATRPGLEDAHRPGHFAGVCQVVRRLFDLIRPAAAIFGEKDWQQLQVVRAMAARDRLGIDIVQGPTVREPDGLAMSSRNRFLPPSDRRRAGAIFRALSAAQREHTPAEAERAMREIVTTSGLSVDYAVVRNAETLAPIEGSPARPGTPMRALIAARLGTVRLLDNAPWPG